MAENLDAEQYRQAFRLVLGELEDLARVRKERLGPSSP